jgi:predicted transcriptional regulator
MIRRIDGTGVRQLTDVEIAQDDECGWRNGRHRHSSLNGRKGPTMPRFGQLEEQVMLRVWAADHPVQVREVRAALRPDRELAHTTVMTVLDKLFRKGWLRRETTGRAYRYSPVMSRDSYTAALLHEAWSTAGNPAAALVHFIEAMNSEQRAALRDALRVSAPALATDQPPWDPGLMPEGDNAARRRTDHDDVA